MDKFGGYISSQKTVLKNKTPILVVDDADAEIIKKVLFQYDYKNVSTEVERPSDEEIRKYPIIITDVMGIGDDLNSNGLLFAEYIKDTFPLKQVIVISGQLQRREYKKHADVLRIVDGVFKKGTSYDELARLLDPCLCQVNDPALVWRRIRQELLSVKGVEKKDTEVFKVMQWEDQFVRSFLDVGRDSQGEGIRGDWINSMTKVAGLASQVVGLLSGIKGLVV